MYILYIFIYIYVYFDVLLQPILNVSTKLLTENRRLHRMVDTMSLISFNLGSEWLPHEDLIAHFCADAISVLFAIQVVCWQFELKEKIFCIQLWRGGILFYQLFRFHRIKEQIANLSLSLFTLTRTKSIYMLWCFQQKWCTELFRSVTIYLCACQSACHAACIVYETCINTFSRHAQLLSSSPMLLN